MRRPAKTPRAPRLQSLGVIREDVGTGRDYKQVATDAFKRAAVRFGVAHELYTDYEILWVQVDGDGKYAKPVEDPAHAYARRSRRIGNTAAAASAKPVSTSTDSAGELAELSELGDVGEVTPDRPVPSGAATKAELPPCPKCGGQMWDNRLSKRNPRAPDFKCRTRTCDGVVWPGTGEPRELAELPF